MNINLELYKTFYYIAKTGSISNAAKELFISQPAVSQSIKQLEESLGGKLFFRTTKGITLTKEGEVLLKYIEQAFNFIKKGEGKFVEMKNLVEGQINISASDTICKYYLAPYLAEFKKRYPKIKIHVTNRTSKESIELLKVGKVDLSIVNTPMNEDKNLSIVEILEINDCFIAGSNYMELKDKILTLEELNKYPIILLEKGSHIRNFIDEYFKSNGLELNPEFELGSIDLLIEFARLGLGISLVVKNFIEDELRLNKIFELNLNGDLPKRNLVVVTLKSFPISMAAKEFIKVLSLENHRES